ncbi:MAG: 2-polyprenylphenol 6-hydroxylase [Alphaproteobacteria bacterium]
MAETLRHLARLARIATTLARHDALAPLAGAGVPVFFVALLRRLARPGTTGRPGEMLARALAELGPSFVKLGQLLSVRSDLVGEAMADDLAALQDRLPPFSGAEARAAIERDLGQPVEALFATFDDRAVAAASIAQVHWATTTEGRAVAVKVLRPGIEAAFERDLALLAWLARLALRLRPALTRLRPVEVVATLAETVRIEMDLRMEAAAAAELAENFAGDDGFRVPEVDWARTGHRVLTLERIEGIPIDERSALFAAGHDPRTILARAAGALFKQAFRDGFFHADLHPGNLFVDTAGRVVAVDFGIMGRLDWATRCHLADILIGFLARDYARVAEAHFAAGYVPAGRSRSAFQQACRAIAEPILGLPLRDISVARLLAQLFRVTAAFGMETQPQLLLLQKSMVVAEGVGRRLDPEVNIWELARPLIEEWAADNRGPDSRLREAVGEGLATAGRVPRILAEAESTLAALRAAARRMDDDASRAAGRGLNQTLLWAVAVAALVLALVEALD